ncbi:MAG: ornithine cyclodeaminase family protein [Acidobacteriota bacterium]
MKIRVINHFEVRQLLPMEKCMEVMGAILESLSADAAVNPLRTALWLPQRIGLLGMMPAFIDSPPITGLKAVTVFPANHGTRYDAHQGAVLLFEASHGCLLAMVDAGSITAVRTAAVSGVATRALAHPEAGNLAILGSGTQAGTHLEAMLLARPIRRVRVWSRSPQHLKEFAERESERHQIQMESCRSARQAVEGSDLICTTTASAAPILRGEWLTPGAHVNAVGSCTPSARELDTGAVVSSQLFVDRRESALREAGDFLIPKKEGAVDDSHIRGEIGEVLRGKIAGRKSQREITLFKSLGLAVEDLAAADYIYRKALERGAGTEVEFGGLRFDGS